MLTTRRNEGRRDHAGAGVMAPLVLAMLWGCAVQAHEVRFTTGEHDRPPGPAVARVPASLEPGTYLLEADGASIPAQVDHDQRVWWWAEAAPAGTSRTYTLKPAEAGAERVQVRQAAEDRVDVLIEGQPFTSMHFRQDETKVYLHPVIGPTGAAVTRHFPMREVEGERRDHPHHRSIWTAHGDIKVGDFDRPPSNYWHEGRPETTGLQRVRRIVRAVSGPVFGQIVAEIDWMAPDGKRDFTETRTYTFFRGDDGHRIIDLTSALKFTEGDTRFGDTKEGGMCAVRVATSMDEQSPGSGRMVNAEGQAGERTIWGKPSPWCDYVGPVNGETVGIAVMDAPDNFRHPVRWHIRAYGLYTANPFGTGEFTGGAEDGSHVFKKDESVTFNYRILIHRGDTREARVADQYRIYRETR